MQVTSTSGQSTMKPGIPVWMFSTDYTWGTYPPITTSGTTGSIKTIDATAIASVKTINGTPIASIKNKNGVPNV